MSEKYLIFTDFHIHNHSGDWRRVDDAIEVLRWILSNAIERNIKKVFFLGDFFHVRGYIYPTVMAKSFNELKKFKDNDIDLYMLTGNHDAPYKNSTKYNSITAFGSIAHVIEQPCLLETDEYNFYWLPYVESTPKTEWAIKNIVAGMKPTNKKNILLAHLDIKGAFVSKSLPSPDGIDPKKLTDCFDSVITGHYHGRQQVMDNIHYIGTPYQQNFTEANGDKGFAIFSENQLEYVDNTFSPKYFYITPTEISETIAGNYVNVRLNDSSQVLQIREAAMLFKPRQVSIEIDRLLVEEERKKVIIHTDTKDVRVLLKEWVMKTANPNIYNIDTLISKGLNLIDETSENMA